MEKKALKRCRHLNRKTRRVRAVLAVTFLMAVTKRLRKEVFALLTVWRYTCCSWAGMGSGVGCGCSIALAADKQRAMNVCTQLTFKFSFHWGLQLMELGYLYLGWVFPSQLIKSRFVCKAIPEPVHLDLSPRRFQSPSIDAKPLSSHQFTPG